MMMFFHNVKLGIYSHFPVDELDEVNCGNFSFHSYHFSNILEVIGSHLVEMEGKTSAGG